MTKEDWYERFEPQLLPAFDSLVTAGFVEDSQTTWSAWLTKQWEYWEEYGRKQQ